MWKKKEIPSFKGVMEGIYSGLPCLVFVASEDLAENLKKIEVILNTLADCGILGKVMFDLKCGQVVVRYATNREERKILNHSCFQTWE